MQEFKKRQKTHPIIRFFATLGGTLLLFVTAGVAVSSAWGMYGTFSVAADARESAERNLAIVKEDEARIRTTVESLGSETGMEREVRERFGVVKPNEGEIQIVRDQGTEAFEAAEEQNIFLRTLRSLFVW